MEYIRPRIRLTGYCNRNCPYCFADDFLSGMKNSAHLKLSEIKKILDMCTSSGIRSVAWQGGEPMIHPQIIDIINMHKEYNMSVSIFSNGLFDSKIIDVLKNLDFVMLINLNHPSTYKSIAEYNHIIENIKIMNKLELNNKISIGYNFYEDNPDYQFFIDAIKELTIKSVRIDMVRPSISENNTHYKFEDIHKIFPKLRSMMNECIKAGAYFSHFDCPFPLCELSHDDIIFAWRHFPSPERMGQCYTYVDIQKDLMISSCFCSYKFENITLNEFESFTECRKFIKYLEDSLRWKVNLKEECEQCKLREYKICQGGCLGYSRKQEKVLINREDLNKYREQKIYEKISFVSPNTFAEFLNCTDSLKNATNDFITFIKNSPYPSYSLYCSLQDILTNKYIEKEVISNMLNIVNDKEHPLKRINEYYLNLCYAEILYKENKLNDSEKYYKKAYQIVNYLDIKFILERLISIHSSRKNLKIG